MGCLQTKRVPEVPKYAGSLVEPVYGKNDGIEVTETRGEKICIDGVKGAPGVGGGDSLSPADNNTNRRTTKKVSGNVPIRSFVRFSFFAFLPSFRPSLREADI